MHKKENLRFYSFYLFMSIIKNINPKLFIISKSATLLVGTCFAMDTASMQGHLQTYNGHENLRYFTILFAYIEGF
jgi:hypothetical protein